MNLGQAILEALESLASNKLRSGLTILGIVIGVGAVIAMLGVGQGAQDTITGSISGIGSNLLFVFSGNMQEDVRNEQPLIIMEIGCGNGGAISYKHPSIRYVAVDIGPYFRDALAQDGIEFIEANVEHDNTPWVLSGGQVAYMRWEYVDRFHMGYHHLWSMNPDGTRQMVLYGNQINHGTILAPKPVSNSRKLVVTWSPGHGRREHYGKIALIDPRLGPDDPQGVQYISKGDIHCDPWAFSENHFLVANKATMELLNGRGETEVLYRLPEDLAKQGYWIGEPRPVMTRPREPVIADQVDPAADHGTLALANIYKGRITRVETELSNWNLFARCMSNDGLIALAIDDAGPALSGLANDLLLACYGSRFSVSILTLLETGKGDQKEGFDIVVHDGESGEARRARRVQTWTPVVGPVYRFPEELIFLLYSREMLRSISYRICDLIFSAPQTSKFLYHNIIQNRLLSSHLHHSVRFIR